MSSKLYVGQLPYSVTSEQLGEHFASAGEVVSAKVIMDRDSGRSKGFGFVEYASESDAQNAISQFDGKDFSGRSISVSVARPQENRRPGGGGGGGGGGGRGFRREF